MLLAWLHGHLHYDCRSDHHLARLGRGDDAGNLTHDLRLIAREMAINEGFCDGAFEYERDHEILGPGHEPKGLVWPEPL